MNGHSDYLGLQDKLNELEDELHTIEAQLKLMWEFDGVDVWSEHETKTHKRATYLRREIAFCESGLEEAAQ